MAIQLILAIGAACFLIALMGGATSYFVHYALKREQNKEEFFDVYSLCINAGIGAVAGLVIAILLYDFGFAPPRILIGSFLGGYLNKSVFVMFQDHGLDVLKTLLSKFLSPSDKKP